jgi:uncharacterized delta-60 repeat protein
VQPDGKVVVAGYLLVDAVTCFTDLFLVRLTPSGALDAGFGSGGKARFNLYPFESPYAVALDAEGRILICGFVSTSSTNEPFLGRLTAGGALDSSFGSGGIGLLDCGFNGWARSMALQPDGKVIVGGTVDNGYDEDFLVGRFTAAGLPDPSFGSGGSTVLNQGSFERCNAVRIQPDGKVLMVGFDSGYLTVARYR